QRFFEKKRAKNFIRLATSDGRRGRSLQTQGAKRRHEVFLLLFVHKKKAFLASLRCASTCSATIAKFFARFFSKKRYFLQVSTELAA
ncbi:MAG TPA: hypothetical protein VL154_11155, partial [Acetobacteraceae bacterium]|nr:hypothetical protein [Acetobacteraceae bacterium]